MNKAIYTEKIGSNVFIADFAVIYQNVQIGDNVSVGEHVVLGRNPKPTTAVVRNMRNAGETVIGSGVSICANAIIYASVFIGENSLLGDNVSVLTDVKIGENVLISRNVTINSNVVIGDNTRIMDNSHITGRSRIGSNVFISVGLTTVNDNLFGKNGYSDDVKGVEIGDFASIGPGVILLPGVKIGVGAIIAAGSIVKEDIPDDVIAEGNPAKIITRVPKYMRRIK